MTLRKAISLIFYLAMIVGGLWVTLKWLDSGGRGIALMAGGFLAGFGAYLLWIDLSDLAGNALDPLRSRDPISPSQHREVPPPARPRKIVG